MPLLKYGKKAISSTGKFMGKRAANFGHSTVGAAAVMIGAGVLGMANAAAPEAVDFAMEGAFGDENADRYFTGMDLSARTLVGQAAGGIVGSAIRNTDPLQNYMINPVAPNPVALGVGGSITGGLLGGAIGGAKKGFKGGALGATLGMLAGGIAGGAIASAVPLGYMRQNKEYFTQSPYTPLGGTQASALNATGDIVLGMHNSRRGY
jgi:hypothetical protein